MREFQSWRKVNSLLSLPAASTKSENWSQLYCSKQLSWSLQPVPQVGGAHVKAIPYATNFIYICFCLCLYIVFVFSFIAHLLVPVFLLFMEMRVRWRGYFVKKDPARVYCMREGFCQIVYRIWEALVIKTNQHLMTNVVAMVTWTEVESGG